MRERDLNRFVLLAALLASVTVHAQESLLRSERLYLNYSGVLVGSTRVIALGGAYNGVAEGPESLPTNLAAIAHRDPHLLRDWDVGVSLSWLDLPFSSRRDRDLDNDGRRDDNERSQQLLGALMLQYKRFGIGWYFRTTTLSYCAVATLGCPGSEFITIDVSQSALAGAIAFGRDDFIVAMGLYSASATLSHHDEGRRYAASGVEFDVLFRPHGLNYRIGLSARPRVLGEYDDEGEPTSLAGRPLYGAAVSPATLSIGASMRFGEGAHLYNRLSPAARKDVLSRLGEQSLGPDEPPDAINGRWLATAQLDLIAATENSVPLSAFVDVDVATGAKPATLVGGSTYFVPRVGVEHDTWRGRLRTRIGSFVEPSPFADRNPRPHLTGGAEVLLFHYWQRWSLSASFDIAARYNNFGIAVGFWR